MGLRFQDFLNEAAKGLESNYVLYKDRDFVFMYITDTELSNALTVFDTATINSKILFVFDIKKDLGLTTFESVYAKRGYGPLAYKTAMTLYGSLAPTQGSQLTNAAAQVWKEFHHGKGSKDVTFEFFGSEPKMEWLRSVYKLKKPLNLSKSLKLHTKIKADDKYKEKETTLIEAADSLLQNIMNRIY